MTDLLTRSDKRRMDTMSRDEVVNLYAQRFPTLNINIGQHDTDTFPIITKLVEQATPNIIALRRGIRSTPLPKWPKILDNLDHHGGIWILETEDEWRCAMCGYLSEVWDHCHTTGLVRGRLCQSCNMQEGFNSYRPEWQLWRWSAPYLQLVNNERHVYQHPSRAPTQHEFIFRDPNPIDRIALPLTKLFATINDRLRHQ